MSKQRPARRSSNDLIFEKLEDKNLLATLATQHIVDPFVDNAVSVQQMVDRASYTPFIANELVVAVDATNNTNGFNWGFLTGDSNVKVVNNLMNVQRDATEVSLYHITLSAESDIFHVMNRLDKHQVVFWSSPNFYQDNNIKDYTPNDPDYGNQYHHPLMQNNDAWDTTLGDPSIIVAVTDDGVDIDHEDLENNIWINTGEIAGNGVDDDGNGYIDDVNGWDFSSGNNDPNPNSSSDTHGTHVSGIAAGDTDNGIGISGTSGASTIMPLQFAGVSSWTAAVINETFTYAADNGAHIVNTSYNINGWVGDPVFTAGLQYLHDNDVLHFNSAGNGNELNPARQAFEQTILVVSTTDTDSRSSFSNYGWGMDISAPGSSILSTLLDDTYGSQSGTSMAAPNAAGAAALLWSANPTWTNYQVIAALYAGADDIDGDNPGFEGLLGAGRVNTFNSLNATFDNPTIQDVPGLPAHGSTVDDLTIDSFELIFDQFMDPGTVNVDSNFELLSAGPDEQFDTADDVVIDITKLNEYMVGSNSVRFQMDAGTLNYGMYRMTVSANLENPFGDQLDGDGNGSGGDDYVHEFNLGAPPAGTVNFHRGTYLVNDNAIITVSDGNASDPITVQVTTSAGDSETLTLNNLGSGAFENTISIEEGSVSAGDGKLNVALGDELTVTYLDLDDGTGSSNSVTDTARINNVLKFDYQGDPVQFSDNTTVFAEINISDSGFVSDLDFTIDLTHTWTSDLDFFLISPSGTRVELFTDVGGSGDDFIGTILDDEATDSIVDGSAPFTGRYRPEGLLSDFDGETIAGTWTLEMTDDAGQDTGEMTAFSLCIDVIPAEIFITNTNDAGPGSLRDAILQANIIEGQNELVFAIPDTGGDYVIQLQTPLPALTDPVVIDGGTQSGFDNRPIVAVDGSQLTDTGVDGFTLEADSIVISNLAIYGFDGDAIQLNSVDNAMIDSNFLGVGLDDSDQGNGETGIRATGDSNFNVFTNNVIGGNDLAGIYLLGDSTDNLIQSNHIGTDSTGDNAVPNNAGIQLLAARNMVMDNVISGNDWVGLFLSRDADETGLQGNRIGLGESGDALPNASNGMLVESQGNLIGGLNDGEANYISGNTRAGIQMRGSHDTVIQGNWVGLNPNGDSVGNGLNGVRAIGSGQLDVTGNTISGNGTIGLFIGGVNSPNATVADNMIGVDPTGATAMGNGGVGFIINGAPETQVSGNVIAGNQWHGMTIVGNNTDTMVDGNVFGASLDGQTLLTNRQSALFVQGAENLITNNVIGGETRGLTFSRGRAFGNVANNNYIGTDMTMTADLGGLFGVTIVGGAYRNMVDGNVITNQARGIWNVSGGSSNEFSANAIYGNSVIGIDNGGAGYDANDADDVDVGPNRMQNSPDLSSAVLANSTLTITYLVDSLNGHSAFPMTIEFFIDEGGRQGRTLVGTDTYTSGNAANGDKQIDLSVEGLGLSAGDSIVATATDLEGNTSEFSLSLTIT